MEKKIITPGQKVALTKEQMLAEIQTRIQEFNLEVAPILKKHELAFQAELQVRANAIIAIPIVADTKYAEKPKNQEKNEK